MFALIVLYYPTKPASNASIRALFTIDVAGLYFFSWKHTTLKLNMAKPSAENNFLNLLHFRISIVFGGVQFFSGQNISISKVEIGECVVFAEEDRHFLFLYFLQDISNKLLDT